MAHLEVILGLPVQGGTGEVNTNTNAGDGEGIVLPKLGVNTPMKSLKVTGDGSISSDEETITIDIQSTGEENTNSNAGTGEGLVLPKVGVDTPMKTLKAGANVGISSDADSITISASSTTAGITGVLFFTADEITPDGTTFYEADNNSKGATAEAIESVSPGDDEKIFFSQDVLSVPIGFDATIPQGNFLELLSFQTESNNGQQRLTTEMYLANNDGTPKNSGIAGAPVGDLGFTVITILDSGIFDNDTDLLSTVEMIGFVLENFPVLANERFLFHSSGEKVGTQGATVTMNIFFGSDYNSHLEIPIITTTDTVANVSSVPGATTSDALETNAALISDNANAIGINITNIADNQDAIEINKTDITTLDNIKIEADDYAQETIGGTLKARLDGTTLFLTNDGSNP